MRNHRDQAGTPADWLRYAHSDLALARARKTRRLLHEHLCFHAQQAAEKALKAVLVKSGLNAPKTHDLRFLMDQLPSTTRLPVPLLELPILTKYAVQLRYPGESTPLTDRDRRRALHLATLTIAWAEQAVQGES